MSAPGDGAERKIEKEDRGAWRTQENCPILLIWTCCRTSRIIAQKRWALHLSRWITKAYPLPNTAASHLTACWGDRQRDLQRCVSNATRTADFTPRSPDSRTFTAATPIWWISRFLSLSMEAIWERCWAGRCGYRRRASGSWSTSSHTKKPSPPTVMSAAVVSSTTGSSLKPARLEKAPL